MPAVLELLLLVPFVPLVPEPVELELAAAVMPRAIVVESKSAIDWEAVAWTSSEAMAC